MCFYLGPNPFIDLDAENVFFPVVGSQFYLSIRQLGHYISKSTSESPCFPTLTSYSECFLKDWAQMMIRAYQCSPMLSAFIEVSKLPLCLYRNLTDDRNMSLLTHVPSVRCLQPCERHLFSLDKDLKSNYPNYIELDVNLASLVYPQFQENFAMDFQMLLGRLGGNLSRWLGANFLVLFHSVIFFIQVPFTSKVEEIQSSNSLSMKSVG